MLSGDMPGVCRALFTLQVPLHVYSVGCSCAAQDMHTICRGVCSILESGVTG